MTTSAPAASPRGRPVEAEDRVQRAEIEAAFSGLVEVAAELQVAASNLSRAPASRAGRPSTPAAAAAFFEETSSRLLAEQAAALARLAAEHRHGAEHLLKRTFREELNKLRQQQ